VETIFIVLMCFAVFAFYYTNLRGKEAIEDDLHNEKMKKVKKNRLQRLKDEEKSNMDRRIRKDQTVRREKEELKRDSNITRHENTWKQNTSESMEKEEDAFVLKSFFTNLKDNNYEIDYKTKAVDKYSNLSKQKTQTIETSRRPSRREARQKMGQFVKNTNADNRLYYFRFIYKGKKYYKIGITSRTLRERYGQEYSKIDKILYDERIDGAMKAEKEIKIKYKNDIFSLAYFNKGGHTEIFDKDVLKLDV